MASSFEHTLFHSTLYHRATGRANPSGQNQSAAGRTLTCASRTLP